MPYETAELIELVFLRPRMFSDAETLRELLLFIRGICTGRNPPHGSDCLPGFDEFVLGRFRRAASFSWPEVLLDEYGGLPFLKACAAIADLVREWRSVHLRGDRPSGPRSQPAGPAVPYP
jgi:hypothetical protein